MTASICSSREVEGTHFVVEYSDCDLGILDDKVAIESLLVRAAESTGGTIVTRVVHPFRPSGVTGCIILSNAHLAIHTCPQAGQASIDLYTSRERCVQGIYAVLEETLRPKDSQILVVDRGVGSPQQIQVRGHRRVVSYTLDCRHPQLPDSIYVGRSPDRGFGLFASRNFSDGELIYETLGTLAEWDAEFIVEHDLGTSIHDADSLGYELSPELDDIWPQKIRDTIARYYGLKNPSLAVIHQHVTGFYKREMLMTAFDGLKNHSGDPNTVIDWPAATIEFDEEGVPRWTIPTLASKPIKSGDELSVDYCTSLFGYVPPSDWLP